jgi:hypothetical protein
MLGENRILRNTVQHKYFILKAVRLVFMELLHVLASYTNKHKRIPVAHAIAYYVMDDIRPYDHFALY